MLKEEVLVTGDDLFEDLDSEPGEFVEASTSPEVSRPSPPKLDAWSEAVAERRLNDVNQVLQRQHIASMQKKERMQTASPEKSPFQMPPRSPFEDSPPDTPTTPTTPQSHSSTPQSMTPEQQRVWNKWDRIDATVDKKSEELQSQKKAKEREMRLRAVEIEDRKLHQEKEKRRTKEFARLAAAAHIPPKIEVMKSSPDKSAKLLASVMANSTPGKSPGSLKSKEKDTIFGDLDDKSIGNRSTRSSADRIADIERDLVKKTPEKNRTADFAAAAAAASAVGGNTFWRAETSKSATKSSRALMDRKQAVGSIGQIDEALSGVQKSAALNQVQKSKKDVKKEEKNAQIELAKAKKMGKKRAKEEERKRIKQEKLMRVQEKKKEKKANELAKLAQKEEKEELKQMMKVRRCEGRGAKPRSLNRTQF